MLSEKTFLHNCKLVTLKRDGLVPLCDTIRLRSDTCTLLVPLTFQINIDL